MFVTRKKYRALRTRCLEQSAELITTKTDNESLRKELRRCLEHNEILRGRPGGALSGPLFDPRREGWSLADPDDAFEPWVSPSGRWRFERWGTDGLWVLNRLVRFPAQSVPVNHYNGAHPTRSLVMAVIEQNGGGV